MSDLKRPASDLKAKFDIARSVDLPVPAPATPVSPPASSAPVSRTAAVSPTPKTAFASLPFTFAFQSDDLETATGLAVRIGCSVDDILLLIAKRFDEQTLDLTTTGISPRFGPSKRVLLKISHATLAQIRQRKDPLNIRSDGYLLRAPVIAALDHYAARVLQELKEKYDA